MNATIKRHALTGLLNVFNTIALKDHFVPTMTIVHQDSDVGGANASKLSLVDIARRLFIKPMESNCKRFDLKKKKLFFDIFSVALEIYTGL